MSKTGCQCSDTECPEHGEWGCDHTASMTVKFSLREGAETYRFCEGCVSAYCDIFIVKRDEE